MCGLLRCLDTVVFAGIGSCPGRFLFILSLKMAIWANLKILNALVILYKRRVPICACYRFLNTIRIVRNLRPIGCQKLVFLSLFIVIQIADLLCAIIAPSCEMMTFLDSFCVQIRKGVLHPELVIVVAWEQLAIGLSIHVVPTGAGCRLKT